jgi:hypothetical protein
MYAFSHLLQELFILINCMQNSGEGKLSTAQLCLASAALVQSASTCSDGDTLASYCIESLLEAVHLERKEEVRQKLFLAVIATTPASNLPLLGKLLEEIKSIIVGETKSDNNDGRMQEQKAELVNALFAEISERVGDREKEFAIRWWFENREALNVSLVL